jgi:hypothetical protein
VSALHRVTHRRVDSHRLANVVANHVEVWITQTEADKRNDADDISCFKQANISRLADRAFE